MMAWQAETCWTDAGIKYFVVFDWISLWFYCQKRNGDESSLKPELLKLAFARRVVLQIDLLV